MELKFYKESTGKWYVDLPNWTGDKADLEMVAGADTMLDIMSDNTSEAMLRVEAEVPFVGHEVSLTKKDDVGNYQAYSIADDEFMPVWLCSVTLFVFGNYPRKIYLKKI